VEVDVRDGKKGRSRGWVGLRSTATDADSANPLWLAVWYRRVRAAVLLGVFSVAAAHTTWDVDSGRESEGVDGKRQICATA